MARQKVQVVVYEKDIFGSVMHKSGRYEHEDDRLVQFRDWISELIDKIPPDCLPSARIAVDSVGGYEGEHHAEVKIYYERPETDAEYKARRDEEKACANDRERREREIFETLKRKFGG